MIRNLFDAIDDCWGRFIESSWVVITIWSLGLAALALNFLYENPDLLRAPT